MTGFIVLAPARQILSANFFQMVKNMIARVPQISSAVRMFARTGMAKYFRLGHLARKQSSKCIDRLGSS